MVFVSGPIPEGRAVERHGPTHEPGGEDSLIAALLNAIYPIGHVYHSTVSTNPATLLGMPASTWTAIATGRVLIAIDAADADFDTVRETGGAKTHGHSDNLSHANGAVVNNAATQAHVNGDVQIATAMGHVNGAVTGDHTAAHTHDDSASIGVTAGADGTAWNAANPSTSQSVNPAAHGFTQPSDHAAHDHGFIQPDAHAVHGHSFTQPDTHGSHAAVNHMPPFYALYIFERTA